MNIIKKINDRLLLKNSILNFGSQGLIIILAFISLPIILKHLSQNDFGLLTILWAVVGYFSLFDFGISRAVTKYLSAEKLSNNKNTILSLIQTSLFIGGIIGFVGFAVLFLSTPLILELLNIDQESTQKAIVSFRIASFGVPFMVLFGIVKGIQSAYHRFDLVNIYQFIFGLMQWVSTIIILFLGFGIVEIIGVIVISRFILSVIGLNQIKYVIKQNIGNHFSINILNIKKLFSFGGWITISQTLSPIFLYLDRFFIGSMISLSVVGYYVVPHEMLSRILIIAFSVVNAIFPMLSEYNDTKEKKILLYNLYVKSLKYISGIIFPVILFLIVFSKEILRMWVGEDISERSFIVFNILAIGFYFNALAQVPSTVLHAINKPNVTAIINIIEIPVLVILNIILIPLFGILGAAIAWTSRVILDCFILMVYVPKYLPHTNVKGYVERPFVLSIIIFSILGIAYYSIKYLGVVEKSFVTLLLIGTYCFTFWFFAFYDTDRKSIQELFHT